MRNIKLTRMTAATTLMACDVILLIVINVSSSFAPALLELTYGAKGYYQRFSLLVIPNSGLTEMEHGRARAPSR